MNPSAQHLATDGLLGPTANTATGDRKSPPSVPQENDNALNNKDFSDVLDDQHSAVEAPQAAPKKRVISVAETAPKQTLMASEAMQALIAADGKTLPADRLPLPPELPLAPQIDGDQSQSADRAPLIIIDQRVATAGSNTDKPAPSGVATAPTNGDTVVSSPATNGATGTNASAQSTQGDKPVTGTATNAAATPSQAPLSAATEELATNRPAATESTAAATAAQTNGNGANGAAPPPALPDIARQLQFAVPQTDSSLTATESSAAGIDKAAAAAGPLPKTEGPATYRQSTNTTVQTAVPVEVGKPGWSETVMQRVMWMSSQNISKAEIALDPPELGPLQVRISTQSDQTSVTFTSHHGAVRDALDQGLPRLREMMESQGLDLADVDVSSQNPRHGGDPGGDDDGGLAEADNGAAAASADGDNGAADSAAQQTLVSHSHSLVDHYV